MWGARPADYRQPIIWPGRYLVIRKPAQRAPNTPEYQQYVREYLTRRAYALIPPLAPAIQ
jgi:hypothetical protein